MRAVRRQITGVGIAVLLLAGTLAATAAAAPPTPQAPPGTISGTVTDGTTDKPCTQPFPGDHTVFIDAFTPSKVRFGPAVADGAGNYSLSVGANDYTVRFRVVGPDGLVAYWWYGPTGGGTTYEQGAAVGVVGTVDMDACLTGFEGGTFKGGVTSAAPGFDPECTTVMPVEAKSGISVALVVWPGPTGLYRFLGDLPTGKYKALARVSGGTGCAPLAALDQWWRGHSGGGFAGMSNIPLASSGQSFAIGTMGAVTGGIHFDLIPVGTCNGLTPTILGTTSDDILFGTPGDDVIMLYDGSDEAFGEDGRDTICGGRGNDVLEGGRGADRLFGEAHRDYLYGGGGVDLLNGGSGVDRLFGGPKGDKLLGGYGDDVIHGNAGDDRLKGNKGDDELYGDEDDDYIDGGGGVDLGDGGPGNDTCHVLRTETRISC